jgi:hypothetical protein
MNCRECGVELKSADKFCYKCGSRVQGYANEEVGKPEASAQTFRNSANTAQQPPQYNAAIAQSAPVRTIETRPAGPVYSPPPGGGAVEPAVPPDSSAQYEAEMKKDIAGWGAGLIIMGILSFVLSQYLDPVWGALIIVLGIVNLAVKKRGMYIANGVALITIGILNIVSTMLTFLNNPVQFFAIYGCLQIYWGIKELVKFRKYGKLIRGR